MFQVAAPDTEVLMERCWDLYLRTVEQCTEDINAALPEVGVTLGTP